MSEDGLSVKERMALWKQKDAAGSKNESPSNASKINPSKVNIPVKVDIKAPGIGTILSPDIKSSATVAISVKSPALPLSGLPSPNQPEVPLTTPLYSPPPPPSFEFNSCSTGGSDSKVKTESSVTKSEGNSVTPERRGSIKDKIAALNAGISSNNTPPVTNTKASIEELSIGDNDGPSGAIRRGSIKDKIAALVSASQAEKDNDTNNSKDNNHNNDISVPINNNSGRKSLNIQKLGVGININALMGIPPSRSRNTSEAEAQDDSTPLSEIEKEHIVPDNITSTTGANSIDTSALLNRVSVPTRKKPSNKPLLLSLD